MERDIDLRDALEHIDPSSLNYQDWVGVGMGLKEAGYRPEDWDAWSQTAIRSATIQASVPGSGTPSVGLLRL